MSGIYIHIPFCKQACHYCNFHFSTSLKHKGEMLNAILKEIALRKDYLATKDINTIYLGGGTPSLLDTQEINQIFEQLQRFYHISIDAEITLEANPDDLSFEYLKKLKKDTPINRLSIGVQSFFDDDLKYMNRAHSAKESEKCIENAIALGFENMSVDLIYGAPTTSNEQWKINIEKIINYNIVHISCYALTVEQGTALDRFIKKGKSLQLEEEKSAQQFEILMHEMQKNGYIHYEISNFAKHNHFAKHNSNYWLGQQYVGIGPSAHSFNGVSRQWNIANNAHYIKQLIENKLPYEIEILTPTQQYNEYVMTSLRTIWGCDIIYIQKKFDVIFYTYFLKNIQKYIDNHTVIKKENKYFLSDKGRLLADNITMELFLQA